MRKRYSTGVNTIIAVLSIAIGIIYVGSTLPAYIELLRCPKCKSTMEVTLMHYWYRWALSLLSILAGYRLLRNLLGTRRLYYVYFTGITVTAIHDLIVGNAMMDIYDIMLYIISPIVVSIVGVIYFSGYYLSSLKNS